MADNKSQTIEEMIEAVEKAIETSISRSKEKDWTLVSDKSGVTLESHLFEDVCPGFHCFRSTGQIDASPSKCADWFWNMKMKDFQEIDDSLVQFHSEDIDKDTKIEHQVNDLPWPLWARQSAVIMRRKVLDDGSIWIVQTSVENAKVPRDDSKYVRVKIYLSAWGFLPTSGDKTKMWRIAHVDPQGNIPAFVVNQFTDKMAGYLHYFKKHAKDIQAK